MEKIVIEKLDHQGRGIGKLNDKVIFVNNALPNEEVNIEITLEKKKYYEGKVVEIIKKSKDRIESICPYFYECGGCDLLHMSYENQLKFKQNKVIDILTKYSKIENIEDKIKDIIPSKNIFNYRNKVTFQVKENIGFYKRKTYDLIPISKCLLITDTMNEILNIIRDNFDLSNIDKVIIKDMGNCQVMLTIYLHNNKEIDKIIEIFESKVQSLNIFIQNKHYKTINKSNIIARLDDFNFLVSSEAFFQVNLDQTVNLYNKVLEYCELKEDDLVLDLYCGTGTIGIFLTPYSKKVLGIEINSEAIKNANENKKINNISNIEFMVGDTKDLIKKVKFKPNVIVVDPPRSGLDKSVIEDIIKLKPERLVYVSCDAITLARDLSLLNEYYEVLEVTPVDMFPNTNHVENVVKLRIK